MHFALLPRVRQEDQFAFIVLGMNTENIGKQCGCVHVWVFYILSVC